jgi:hypothetical protein
VSSGGKTMMMMMMTTTTTTTMMMMMMMMMTTKTTTTMTMFDVVKEIWKAAVVAYSPYYSSLCLREEFTKTVVRKS